MRVRGHYPATPIKRESTRLAPPEPVRYSRKWHALNKQPNGNIRSIRRYTIKTERAGDMAADIKEVNEIYRKAGMDKSIGMGDVTRGSKSARALYTARVKRSLAFSSSLLSIDPARE
jgi:hypothetical protein